VLHTFSPFFPFPWVSLQNTPKIAFQAAGSGLAFFPPFSPAFKNLKKNPPWSPFGLVFSGFRGPNTHNSAFFQEALGFFVLAVGFPPLPIGGFWWGKVRFFFLFAPGLSFESFPPVRGGHRFCCCNCTVTKPAFFFPLEGCFWFFFFRLFWRYFFFLFFSVSLGLGISGPLSPFPPLAPPVL